ncbi:hypothetical protein [[Mycoplasma] collis]|uniref:hypothetical protein n=1 Tax=[Mycoplasma] collis TaxID=2127 RepID=UPI00051C4C2A|nr:hypothetical protein [[Mycoplasma] collis]
MKTKRKMLIILSSLFIVSSVTIATPIIIIKNKNENIDKIDTPLPPNLFQDKDKKLPPTSSKDDDLINKDKDNKNNDSNKENETVSPPLNKEISDEFPLIDKIKDNQNKVYLFKYEKNIEKNNQLIGLEFSTNNVIELNDQITLKVKNTKNNEILNIKNIGKNEKNFLNFIFEKQILERNTNHKVIAININSNEINVENQNINFIIKNNVTRAENGKVYVPGITSAGAENKRSIQHWEYWSTGISGYYLKAGIKGKLILDVQGDNIKEKNLHLAFSNVYKTKNNHPAELWFGGNKLKNLQSGRNEIEIDTTSEPYEMMVYIINETNEPVNINFEAEPNWNNILAKHPYYIFDDNDKDYKEKFWNYVQDLKKYNKQSNFANMSILEFNYEDQGSFQIATGSTIIANTFDHVGITNKEKAFEYIETFSKKLHKWLKFIRFYDGYETIDFNDEANGIVRTKVFLTSGENYAGIVGSNFFATKRFFNLWNRGGIFPFLTGDDEILYTWSSVHEFGHTIDNEIITVPEITNNLFSIEGRMQLWIDKIKNNKLSLWKTNEEGKTIDFSELVKKHIHPAVASFENFEEKLQIKKLNPKATIIDFFDNIKNEGARFYTWYLVMNYFKYHNYDNYDFEKFKQYNKQFSETVNKFGLYGAITRTIRERKYDSNLLDEISKNNEGQLIKDKVKYKTIVKDEKTKEPKEVEIKTNIIIYKEWRIAYFLTLVSGYNFVEILERFGNNNAPLKLKEFASKYPKLEIPIEYYSLKSDLLEASGIKTFSSNTKPSIEYIKDGPFTKIKIDMKDYEKSTIAYEIYRNNQLLGFTRKNEFSFFNPAHLDAEYHVVAFDYRLNKSLISNIVGPNNTK